MAKSKLSMPHGAWRHRDQALCQLDDVLPAGHPAVMGVLNLTPDSFFDGGRYNELEAAVARGIELAAAGAHIIDIGGESTRPGAMAVAADEEMSRVVPVIERLVATTDVPISIDTTKATVAAAALDAGAGLVNDVSAGSLDEEMLPLIARRKCPVVLMHMQGRPRTMQLNPHYRDIVREVACYLKNRRKAAIAAGIDNKQIILDPGIGFGKRLEHNLCLLRNLDQIVALGSPVLVGVSRKSFIGQLLDLPAPERLEGTSAAVTLAVAAGARIVRVHDVRAMLRVVKVAEAICQGSRVK